MKRIAFFVGLLLLAANSAEARGPRQVSYSQPVARPTQTVTHVASASPTVTAYKPVMAAAPTAASNSHSTATAQGVANIMASRGTVGHFGGNSGYEGCGMASTKEAAYSICCYANSGMATVDVGYAQGSNGMWYCCRRYR